MVGRAGLLVVRRPLSRQLAGTAPARGSRLTGAGATGLAGDGRIRSARRRVAPQVGRGLHRLRRRRETVVAALTGRAVLPDRRLGGARWLPSRWPGEFGAAVSRDLGYRPRRPGPLPPA